MNLDDELRYGVWVTIPELERQGISLEQIKQIRQIMRSYQGNEPIEREESNEKVDKDRMTMFKDSNMSYEDKVTVLFEREL